MWTRTQILSTNPFVDGTSGQGYSQPDRPGTVTTRADVALTGDGPCRSIRGPAISWGTWPNNYLSQGMEGAAEQLGLPFKESLPRQGGMPSRERFGSLSLAMLQEGEAGLREVSWDGGRRRG